MCLQTLSLIRIERFGAGSWPDQLHLRREPPAKHLVRLAFAGLTDLPGEGSLHIHLNCLKDAQQDVSDSCASGLEAFKLSGHDGRTDTERNLPTPAQVLGAEKA